MTSKKLIVGYFFLMAQPFDKFQEKLDYDLDYKFKLNLIWTNMDYAQLYISRLSKLDVLKSPGHVDLALLRFTLTILYSIISNSNGRDNYEILIFVNRVLMCNYTLGD